LRLIDLHLKAFGPFTDHSLNFNPEVRFHLVYGPNESGKSSTLRALRTLLYGFARQTRENFLHPGPKLQVGGRFLNGKGESVELVRLKRSRMSLVTPQGEPVDDGTLERLLGGLSPEMFDRLYGLSHSNLVSGGQALIKVGGRVGESLFAATLGPEYQNLVKELRTEYEAIWTNRSSTKPLDECIRAWESAQAESKELALPAEAWLHTRDELKRSLQRIGELKSQYAEVKTREERVQRLLKGGPQVARRRELLQQLKNFQGLPDLPPGFREQRLSVQTELAVAEKRLAALELELEELEGAVSKPGLKLGILDHTGRIEALFQKVAAITEHALERPQLVAQMAVCGEAIERLQLSLGHRGEERPTLPAGRWRSEARKRAQEYLRLESTLEETEDRLRAVAQELNGLEVVEQDQSLEQKTRLEQALQLGRLEVGLDESVVKLLSEIRTATSTLHLELEKLPCWSGDLASLRDCRVPSAAMVEEAERKLSESSSQLERARQSLTDNQQRLAKLNSELTLYTSGQDLYTLEDIEAARMERNELWSDLYHSWMSGDSPHDVGSVVDRYSRAVQSADLMADEVISCGEQLLRLEHLKEQLRAERALEVRLKQKLNSEEQELAQVEQEWQHLWSESGVLLGTPRQMLSWLSQREELLRQARRVEHRQLELERTQQKLARSVEELSSAAVGCGLDSFDPDRGLSPALSVVEQRVEELRRLLQERESLLQRRRELERQSEGLSVRAVELRAELNSWEEEWTVLLHHYPFSPSPRPRALEDLLLQMEELGQELERESRLKERLRRIEAELAAFASEVALLRKKLEASPEIGDVEVVEQARRELRSAQQAERERDRLQRELARKREVKSVLLDECSVGRAALEQLMKQAEVESEELLTEREQQTLRKAELSKELSMVENNLRSVSGSDSLQTFCLEVEEVELDTLPGELELLNDEMTRLAEQREKEVNRSGQLEARLESLDGTSRSARLRQEAATAEAMGRELLDRYVRLALAERLLTDQMEHYRKENEGPVLERAGHYFGRLTDGCYQGLRTGYDPKDGELVLQAVASSGREVPIEGLSDGTCDQLFLALRLAAISRSAQSGALLPVLADDLLVHFDEPRAASTLETLLNFSELTQVILFTHLERDLLLARGLPSDRVDIVELPALNL
jgi:uncharacterized protein YhaN